ncbi:hypothetical protein BJ508DRAFT_159273 [Ascobolus immersus RN42]|uniref:F-box domain-containing protein n=1 Tax=Ascobolus immersus RN42 TaxID=1160509 RepID=A0A3N4IIS9_ASCIM|nr:hypothetical protein BJ508DRAFT_159273 [Ascobolus immersus RN42]
MSSMVPKPGAMVSSASPSRRIPHFLTLPTELRLEIYSHCTIFGLLNLTHTCRTLYLDINTCKRLLQSFAELSTGRAPTERNSRTHLILPADAGIPISIPMIAYYDRQHTPTSKRGGRLSGLAFSTFRHHKRPASDVREFNKVCGLGAREDLDKKGWWCCCLCREVKKSDDFKPMDFIDRRISHFCDDCWSGSYTNPSRRRQLELLGCPLCKSYKGYRITT